MCNNITITNAMEESLYNLLSNDYVQYMDNNNTIKRIELPYMEWSTIGNLQEILLKPNITIHEELASIDTSFVKNKYRVNISNCKNIEKMLETIYDNEYENQNDISWLCNHSLNISKELTRLSNTCYRHMSTHNIMDCHRKVMELIYSIGVDQTNAGYTIKIGPTIIHSLMPKHITTNKVAEKILHKYSKYVFVDFIKYVLKHVYPKVYSTPIDTSLFSGLYYTITKMHNVYNANINTFIQSILEMSQNINVSIEEITNLDDTKRTSTEEFTNLVYELENYGKNYKEKNIISTVQDITSKIHSLKKNSKNSLQQKLSIISECSDILSNIEQRTDNDSIIPVINKIKDSIEKVRRNHLPQDMRKEMIINEYYSFAAQTNYLIQLIEQNNKLKDDPTIKAYLLHIKNI